MEPDNALNTLLNNKRTVRFVIEDLLRDPTAKLDSSIRRKLVDTVNAILELESREP